MLGASPGFGSSAIATAARIAARPVMPQIDDAAVRPRPGAIIPQTSASAANLLRIHGVERPARGTGAVTIFCYLAVSCQV